MDSCWTCGSPWHGFESCPERISNNPQHYQQSLCQYEDQMMARLSQKLDVYIDKLNQINQDFSDTYIDPMSITSLKKDGGYSKEEQERDRRDFDALNALTGVIWVDSDDEYEEGYGSKVNTEGITTLETMSPINYNFSLLVSSKVGEEVVENITTPYSSSLEEPLCLLIEICDEVLGEINLLPKSDGMLNFMEKPQSMNEHTPKPLFIFNSNTSSTLIIPSIKVGEEYSSFPEWKVPLQEPLNGGNFVIQFAHIVEKVGQTIKRRPRMKLVRVASNRRKKKRQVGQKTISELHRLTDLARKRGLIKVKVSLL